jgi:hypothetical protein
MDRPTRALSLRQPWASAVIIGGKNIENRTWNTNFRGRVIIHAGAQLGMPDWDWDQLNWEMEQLNGGPLPRSTYLGEVDIVDCVPIEDLDHPEDHPNRWAFGPYCWVLANPVAYPEPIPAKGKLGLYRVEDLP